MINQSIILYFVHRNAKAYGPGCPTIAFDSHERKRSIDQLINKRNTQREVMEQDPAQ